MNLEQRVVELARRTARYRNALVMLLVLACAVAVVGATTGLASAAVGTVVLRGQDTGK